MLYIGMVVQVPINFMAYAALSQQVGGNSTQKHGSAGDIDIFGRWKFYQTADSTSVLGFSLEQRHKWSIVFLFIS